MKIRRVECGAYAANAYIVDDVIVIDPGDDLEALSASVQNIGAILLTHGHFDHMLAAEPLQQQSGAPVYVHGEDAAMLSDAALSAYHQWVSRLPQPKNIISTEYPENILGFRVLHTPGHTPGSVCLYNEAEKVIFTGDTLFRAGYGRFDLPGGDANELIASLGRLLMLPDDVVVYPGHGATTTIGEERRRYGR